MIAGCSPIQQTNQVPDTTSKAGKSVSTKTNIYYFYYNKNVISIKDAIKIVESLQYLNF